MIARVASVEIATKAADAAARAHRRLRRRWAWSSTVTLLTLAAVAWGFTWLEAALVPMPLIHNLSLPAAFLFVPIWITMTVAMMFPSFAPVVLAHHAVVTPRGGDRWATIALAGGYLLVWSATGLVAIDIMIAFCRLSTQAPPGIVAIVSGGILVAAGVYQFTTWKNECLEACRHPVQFVLTHDFGSGVRGSLRTGASYGLFCLGCCWPLMAVLISVGMMDLGWMAVLTLIILAEKNWRYGVQLSWVVGSVVAYWGAATVLLALPDGLPPIAAWRME
jgi:predicted metal-binding membrane protein